MKHVNLDGFSLLRSHKQGLDLYNLISEHPDLRERFPGTAHRYGRSPAKSAFHVGRVSLAENMQAFILRDRRHVARGIGTVIGPQTVSCGDMHLYGYDVDYWTAEADPHLEEDTVRTLIRVARGMDGDHWQNIDAVTHSAGTLAADHPEVAVYGVVQAGNPYNVAITTVMEPTGPVADVRVQRPDHMGISVAAPAQLYVASSTNV